MIFTQKIYINNKPLILTNDSRGYIHEYKIAEGYLILKGAFIRNFRLATEHLSKFRSLGVIIEDISKEALEATLHELYTPIDAGGGVVVNEEGAVLMIYRRGKWDLPKGKCDEGETIETCALREVREETGLQQLTLEDKICDTYHVYNQFDQRLLKRTTWFRMIGSKEDELIPQAEENILQTNWVSIKDLPEKLFKSYEAIREVISVAGINGVKK